VERNKEGDGFVRLRLGATKEQDAVGGARLTIEIGAEFPIGITGPRIGQESPFLQPRPGSGEGAQARIPLGSEDRKGVVQRHRAHGEARAGRAAEGTGPGDGPRRDRGGRRDVELQRLHGRCHIEPRSAGIRRT
jgi:hypothetical protein